MILPKNGRIVVIDDDREEAVPLIKSLSKEGYSVQYFNGDRKELPTSSCSDVRVVFLDINLINSTEEKNIISTLLSVLSCIIDLNKKTHYHVVFWAKDDHLIDMVMGKLNEYPCSIKYIILDKIKYHTSGYNIPQICAEIQQKLPKDDPFNFFIYWENLVHQSTNDIVTDFVSLFENKETWDDNMCSVFRRLAMAHAGKNLSDDSADISENAMLAFNGTFIDSMESNICNFKFDDLCYNNSDDIDAQTVAAINSKLLISNPSNKHQPGNVYLHSDEIIFKQLCSDIVNGNKILDKMNFEQNVKHILCEVSPGCDYSQKKWKVHRFVNGLIVLDEYVGSIAKSGYLLKTPLFIFNNKPSIAVFDLRHFMTKEVGSFTENSIFRFRNNMVVDLQHKIAHHASRPGFVSL